MTAMSGTGISGLAVGMTVTGQAGQSGYVPAGTVIAALTAQGTLTLSAATTNALTTPTFTGDVFKMLLIRQGTYSGTQQNVGTPGTGGSSVTNVGTDEVLNGSGYATNGFSLINVSPVLNSTAGVWSFVNSISWTSASFTTTGGIIYNSSVRLGAAANGITPITTGSAINRAISYHDFGGPQTVSVGTFTVVLPAVTIGSAILQIS
jgi:hypothetical protein